jgi:hypothetical protein
MGTQPAKRHVIPPAVEAERMQRYSVLLMIGGFVLLGANYAELTPSNLLWFAALLLAVVAIVLASAAVVMRGLQWHYDRLADEFRGIARVTSTDISGRSPEEGAPTGGQPG